MDRGDNYGGGQRRGFGEDRRGGRFQEEGDRRMGRFHGEEDREARREEELRCEWQLRDRMARNRKIYMMGDPRGFRDGDQAGKRRAMEPSELDRDNYQNSQRVRFQQTQSASHISVLDRIVGNRWEQNEKSELVSNKNAAESSRNGVCFRCRQEGHHQANCTNPPFCFNCKYIGHMAAKCLNNKECSMRLLGFGFPEQGYYCLKIPGAAKQQTNDQIGLIQVQSGDADADKIERELKNLIDNKWAWKVRQLSEMSYLASFPNKMIMDTFSRSKSMVPALYNITVSITHSNLDIKASVVLHTGWVQLHNVPDPARNSEAVTLIAELAGEVMGVDEVSLIKAGPIRVKLRVRELARVKGHIEIFIEGVGYEIKFLPEQVKSKKTEPRDPSPPPKPDDNDSSEEDDEADGLSDFEGKVNRALGGSANIPKAKGHTAGRGWQ
ncbi:hypothetical protein PVAP13_2KG399300 [Panicum virgatum]|uniref:CCHC-type domain-containing protein n=1 Tax=Panicum virgatum TaxID=38727 RepID=A0A8T0WDS2_PANVG|nr:hypothetical protein PVAP13_2KG399300 [Panicum virgatum]